VERVKEAAIRKDGVVYTGRNHAEILRDKTRPFGFLKCGEQGFATDSGRYVDREEAARVALASGQIDRLHFSDTELYSEELRFEFDENNNVIREKPAVGQASRQR